MYSFNQFQRELNKRGIDRQSAFMLTHIYETIIEQQKQLDMLGSLINQLAESVQNFVSLNEMMVHDLNVIKKRFRPDGVEVQSVLPDPDSEH